MTNQQYERGNVENYYRNYYSRMMGHDSDGILSILWKYPHLLMEKPFKSNKDLNILELGFGEGEHVGFVAPDYKTYLATDLDAERLERVQSKLPARVSTQACDALNLPFKDGEFDLVTISFGLRNTQNTPRALAEMLRVTKSGGHIVICEFSSPTFGPFRTIYTNYLMKALPAIASKTSSNPDAYIYLAESIRAWPNQSALASTISAAGWADVTWTNLTGGVVAVHKARKP